MINFRIWKITVTSLAPSTVNSCTSFPNITSRPSIFQCLHWLLACRKCRFPNDERAICQYISSSTHFGILLNILRIVEWRIRLFSVGILDWVYIWISSEENAKIRFLISEFFFCWILGALKPEEMRLCEGKMCLMIVSI